MLLVGRGSTDPDANAEVAKVARLLWEGRGYAGVETAFISLARAVGRPRPWSAAAALGARRIVVLPYFLFSGRAAGPGGRAGRGLAAGHGDLDVRVAGLIGDCDELADAGAGTLRRGARAATSG